MTNINKKNNGFLKILNIKDLCFLNQNNNYLLNTFLFVFCFFAFLSLFNHIFMYVAVLIITVASIILNTKDVVTIFVFTYPFEVLFNFNLNGNNINIFPYLNALIFLVIGIKYIIKVVKKQEILDRGLIISIVIFLTYLLIPINKINIVDSLQYFAVLGIVYLLLKNKKELDIKQIINYSVLGLIVSVFFSVVLYFNNIYGSFYEFYYTDGILKVQGLFVNPNYLMMFACFLSAYLKAEFVRHGKSTTLIQWLFVFIIGYTTISRNFLFCEIAIFLFLLISCYVKKNKFGLKNLLVIFVFSLAIMLILFDYSKTYYLRLKYFIKSTLSGENSTPIAEDTIADPGRILIWKRYLKSYFDSIKSILFGYGISAPLLMIKTHNTYIYGFWLIGIVGMALLSFLMIKIMFFDNKNKNSSFWSVLISFLVLSFFESNFLNIVFLIMFAILMACSGGTINEKTKNS